MHECTSIIILPSISSLYFLFMSIYGHICFFDFFWQRDHSKSTFVMKGGGRGVLRVLKKRTKTNRGRGVQVYFYVHSVKKIVWFFKQRIEFFLISCLAVAKGFSVLSLVQHIEVRVFYQKGVDIFKNYFMNM